MGWGQVDLGQFAGIDVAGISYHLAMGSHAWDLGASLFCETLGPVPVKEGRGGVIYWIAGAVPASIPFMVEQGNYSGQWLTGFTG